MIDIEAIEAWANERANEHASELVGFINDLIAEVRGLREGIKAYQALCVCYRLGRRPSEAVFTRIEKARKLLEES